jgi:hypothetical protein
MLLSNGTKIVDESIDFFDLQCAGAGCTGLHNASITSSAKSAKQNRKEFRLTTENQRTVGMAIHMTL